MIWAVIPTTITPHNYSLRAWALAELTKRTKVIINTGCFITLYTLYVKCSYHRGKGKKLFLFKKITVHF